MSTAKAAAKADKKSNVDQAMEIIEDSPCSRCPSW